jgi:hypothetical protein
MPAQDASPQPIRFREFLMARPCRYAISKVEEWRSVDLADLRRWRMLDPARLASTGKIPAVTWNTPDGFDKLGVIAQPRGVLFVRRDEQGHFGKLFVPFTFTPTKFGGWRAPLTTQQRTRSSRGAARRLSAISRLEMRKLLRPSLVILPHSSGFFDDP